MVKPNAKVYLALAGIALSAASVVTVFLMVLQGSPHWGQLLLFVVTAILGFVSALLLWMVGTRQLRVERVHSVHLIRKALTSTEVALRGDIAALCDDVSTVRDQNVALEERQRKTLNVVRSEASAIRGRLAAIIEAWKRQDEDIRNVQRSLVGVGALRDELDSLRILIKTDSASGAESSSEVRDELKELRTQVRRVVSGIDIVDSRDRKMMNLLRGEIRDSAARSDDVKRALATEGGKAAKAADETGIAVRKMHNFLRRDGSIQSALDRFNAAERRILAAVEVAGLDHADQIVALKAASDADREREDAVRSRLGSDLSSGLAELRGEVNSSLVGFGAALNELRHHVSGSSVSEARLLEVINCQSDELSARIDASLGGLDDKLVDLRKLLDEIEANGDAESSHYAHLHGSVDSGVPASLSELTRAYDSVSKTVARGQTERLERYIKRQSIDVIRQVEALMQLIPRVESQLRRYPPSGWWALPADTLLFLSDYIVRERPRRILEVGSGSSTVWTATFAKQVGAELVSLEHDANYVHKSRALVSEYELQDVATVLHAPLRHVELEEGAFEWYDPEVISTLEGPFDLLIVDGPPEATGSKARMPALPMLEHLLAENCLVLLDDTHRPDEVEILNQWIKKFRGFESLSGDLMRTGVLSRHSTS